MADRWRRWIGAAAAVSAALALSGCNVVVTQTPLFGPADAAATPPLREGLWAAVKDGCKFDERQTVDAWPDCARWFLVRGDVASAFNGDKDGWDHFRLSGGRLAQRFEDEAWEEDEHFLLAAGEPLIGQVAQKSPGAAAEGYFYVAFKPRFDAQGRVVEVGLWPVLCGPPPAKARKGEPQAYRTRKPFSGLTMVEDNCTTDSPAVLRAAARASERFEDDLPTARWVREGEE